jgi:alkylhydroperoxidase family enzyme
MPRIEPVPASPEGNPVTNSLLARVMGRCPEVLEAFGRLDATIRFRGRLGGELCEAVRQATAATVGCDYCSSLGDGEQSRPGPEQARIGLAVAFAQMVAEDPAGITDAQVDVLRETFSEEEIVELVAFICLVSIGGQMFGAVMGLEPAPPDEAAGYQDVLLRQQERARARNAAASSTSERPA